MLYKYLIDSMQTLVFGKHSHDKRLYSNPNLTLKPWVNNFKLLVVKLRLYKTFVVLKIAKIILKYNTSQDRVYKETYNQLI